MAALESSGCVAADLPCDEVAESLRFTGGDLGELSDDRTRRRHGVKSMGTCNDGSETEQFVDLPLLSDECFGWMIERERKYLPRDDYLKRLTNGELDGSLRREALDWMLKACAHHSFGELCLYSAVNHLDRFLSVYDLPIGKAWAVHLVAVACLSIAAKMDEVNVPNAVDLQCGLLHRYLFESKTVQRMELLVLSQLKWEIKPYTPLHFVEYFLRKMNQNESPPLLVSRSTRIITSTIKGIDFLEFRSSEIAAAVSMYVSGEMQVMDISAVARLSCFIGVEKGRVVRCLQLIQDMMPTRCITARMADSGSSTVTLASISSAESFHNNTPPEAKRRKMNQTRSLGDAP